MPELSPESPTTWYPPNWVKGPSGENHEPCDKCGRALLAIMGRKDAICQNCGLKQACCGN